LRRRATVFSTPSPIAEDRVIDIQRAAPLDAANTLALPARADAFAAPRTVAEVRDALQWARQEGVAVTPLGEGSNVVLAGDLPGLVLKPVLQGVETIAEDGDSRTLRVAAGQNWHAFVERCLREGLYGLENLALIPGAVGAAPIQNIGAYGVELESFIHAVHALSIERGEALVLEREECAFGYRDSVFKHALRDSVVITAVDLKLPLKPCVKTNYPSLDQYLSESGTDSPTPVDVFSAVVAIRSARLPDPASIPNAGSFFKNPIIDSSWAAYMQARHSTMPVFDGGNGRRKLSAAWLIEQCGWKGKREGGVGVHAEHALVLVHTGGATGADLLALADHIQSRVLDTFGVTLEIEPRVYGAVQ